MTRTRRFPLIVVSLVLISFGAPPGSAQPRFVDAGSDVERAFDLLEQRLALMSEVAAWKWQHHKPISDPARERALLERTRQRAQTLGIDANSASELLSLQMRLARDVQQARFADWQKRGFRAAQPVRDLGTGLRPELDRIGEELLRTLALALPQLAQPDFCERFAQRAAQLAERAGLPAAEGPALLGALAHVRASGDTRKARILATKLLRFGTTGDYAPFSLEAGGALSGVDVELARAFADSLGVAPRFVRTSWSKLLADYAAGAFDIGLGGISVTAERARLARFSLPYRSGGKTPIALCRARRRFDTLAKIDRPRVRVVVNPGGTNEAFARERLRAAQLTVFPDNRLIFHELLAGRADVMITDDVEAELQRRRHPELCRTTSKTFTQADKAWLVQADPELLALVDAWLHERIADGTVARLLEQELSRASSTTSQPP
jgi:cyclohexadienyl dehydratase